METAVVALMAVIMAGAVILCWRIEHISNQKNQENTKQGGTAK